MDFKPQTEAGRRYLWRFFPGMAAYLVALPFSNWAIGAWEPQGAALVALAFLPALPILAVIATIGLYVIEETDEFLRQRVVTAMLGGLALMLAVATGWGFLEQRGVVPHVPAYFAFILWCGGWGVAQCAMALRDRLADGRA